MGVNSEGPPESVRHHVHHAGYLRVAGSDVRTLSYWTGRDPSHVRTAAFVASVIRKNQDPGILGIEPIPGIEPTVMK